MVRIRSWIRKESGQAMAEFVVFSPVLILIFIAIMYFGRGYYLKHKNYTAARYCAWYCARHESKDYVNCQKIQRTMAYNGAIKSHAPNATEQLEFVGPTEGGDMPDGLSGVSALLSALGNATYYTVKTKLFVPKVLKFMGSLKTASSTHVVMADCWNSMSPEDFVTSQRNEHGVGNAGGYADYP